MKTEFSADLHVHPQSGIAYFTTPQTDRCTNLILPNGPLHYLYLTLVPVQPPPYILPLDELITSYHLLTLDWFVKDPSATESRYIHMLTD